MRRWLAAWNAAVQPSKPSSGPALVYIDPEALARRHPAWQLADSLQRGSQPVQARTRPVSLPTRLTPPPEVTVDTAPTTIARSAEVLIVRGREQTEQRRQSTATERFLADFSRRDALRLSDFQRWARQFLEDEVENARRQALSEIDPALLSSSEQLTLTNLQLQYALAQREYVRASTAEKPGVLARMTTIKSRIAAIELDWQSTLRAQERAQLEELRKALNEVPERVRRQGEERIKRIATRIRSERATSREAVREEQTALLANDFAPGSLNLAVRLPAVTEPAPPTSGPNRAQFSKTISSGLASAGPREVNEPLAVPTVNATPAQLARLRATARADAKEWARLAALGLGRRWTSSSKAPNRTREALAFLTGSGGPRRQS